MEQLGDKKIKIFAKIHAFRRGQVMTVLNTNICFVLIADTMRQTSYLIFYLTSFFPILQRSLMVIMIKLFNL